MYLFLRKENLFILKCTFYYGMTRCSFGELGDYTFSYCRFPRCGRLPKKACLNNEVYGLRPAGAAIKTIDSCVCLRGMQMLARAQWLLWRSRGSKYQHNCLPFPQGWLIRTVIWWTHERTWAQYADLHIYILCISMYSSFFE